MTYSPSVLKTGKARETVTNSKSVICRINDNGRIVIPAEIRQKMGIQPGDALVLSLDGEVLKVEPQRVRVRRVQESLRRLIPPDRVLSNELAAERRSEVQHEMEEWLG